MQCTCNGEVSDNFTTYEVKRNSRSDDETDNRNSEEEHILGFLCKSCHQEWLREEYLNNSGNERIIINGESFKRQSNSSAENIRFILTEINSSNFGTLQVGDHVCWERPYVITHHALVVEVKSKEKQIKVIHYSGHKNETQKCQVREEFVYIEKEMGTMFKIDYPEYITEKNIPALVTSRARARLEEAEYGFLGNNCENLVSFCKTGISFSRQVIQALNDLVRSCVTWLSNASLRVLISTGSGEIIERLSKCSNALGAGVVVIIGGYYMVKDLIEVYGKKDELTPKLFAQDVAGIVTVGGVTIGIGILGSMASSLIASALLGTLGIAAGRLFVGPLIAYPIKKCIGFFMERDDSTASGPNGQMVSRS